MRVAVVSPIAVRYDAISLAVRDTVAALASDPRFDVVNLGTACDFPDMRHRSCGNVADLLLAPEYQSADAAIFHFGIYHNLFDALLVKGPPVQVVRFHNVTPARFVNPTDIPIIERSLRQIENLRHAHEIWADSQVNADVLLERGFDPARIRVIPLVVEEPSHARLATKSVDRVEVLFISRIAPSKGVHDLINAVGQLNIPKNALRVTIVGNTSWSDPQYLRLVHDLIGKHELTEIVRFAGTIDDEEREKLFRSAHIMALPSYHEGFCRPVVEGLRAGCIPLVYDAYNLPYIVDKLGCVSPVGDVQALSGKLAELVLALPNAVKNPEKRILSLDRGKTSVNEFDDLTRKYTGQFTLEKVGTQIRRRLLRLS
jgi:glycosyltransferase involved in cell wall biosynthesis